jgi:hypothetical protein
MSLAIKLYYNDKDGWPVKVIALEQNRKVLQEGPYGRCVYHCDNDVVDHQVANLLFDNEVTVAFTMTAFTNEISRTFKIMGTVGEIHGDHKRNEIEIIHFSGKRQLIHLVKVEGGHDGQIRLLCRTSSNRFAIKL